VKGTVNEVNVPTSETLAELYEAATTEHDSRAADAIALSIRRLVSGCLRLPTAARSYREDCVQELTFGLYMLLRRWHADGRLTDIRSLAAFVRHYVRWHAPPAMSRLAFRVAAPAGRQHALSEGQLRAGVDLSDMPLRRDASGCHQAFRAMASPDTVFAQIDHEIDIASLDTADRRALELAGNGETGRRRIELCLVAEFGLSHRQARRLLDGLPDRLRG